MEPNTLVTDLQKFYQQMRYRLMYAAAEQMTPESSLFDTLNFDEQIYKYENRKEDFTYYENGNVEYEDILIDIDEDGIIDFKKFTFYDEEGSTELTRYTIYDEQGNEQQEKSIYYDEQGNIEEKKYTIYDEQGNAKQSEKICYDKQGNVASKSKSLFFYIDTNNDGEIEQENEILYNEQGNVRRIDCTTYNENRISNSEWIFYDKQGNVETVRHFTYNDDGSTDNKDILYDEQGNVEKTKYTIYDGQRNKKQEEYAIYDENGNAYYKKELSYENGLIAEEKIFEDENFDGINDVEIINTYNSNGEIINSEFNHAFEGDETIGVSRQNVIGDCWLLAGLNALNNTPNGREIIKNAITINDDGTYNVYFKGIDSTYTITEEEIIEAKSKDIYSRGDVDMLVMELAFEKVFNEGNSITTEIEELDKDLHNLDNEKERHVLDGGQFEYVTYLLTGETVIKVDKSNISEIDPEATPTFLGFYNATITDINGYEIQLSYGGGHAWSLQEIDGNVATIINPHNSGKEIRVNIEELINCPNLEIYILN